MRPIAELLIIRPFSGYSDCKKKDEMELDRIELTEWIHVKDDV
jgi:hypothetical protein